MLIKSLYGSIFMLDSSNFFTNPTFWHFSHVLTDKCCVSPVSVFLMWTTWGSRILSDSGLLFKIDVEEEEEVMFPGLEWPELKKTPPPVSSDFKCCWVVLECWALRSMETLLAASVMTGLSSGVGKGNGGVNSGFGTPLLGSTDISEIQFLLTESLSLSKMFSQQRICWISWCSFHNWSHRTK